MPDEQTLELAINTLDEEVVRGIESDLGSLNPQRWKDSRDIGTVIMLMSSAVGLVNALLALKDRLVAERNAPRVTVKNRERVEVDLHTATREELERLLAD